MNQFDTMSEALQSVTKQGFIHNFTVKEDGIHCIETGDIIPPENLTIVNYHRFEGVSDPDDMAILYVVESDDGLRGTLVDSYGAYYDTNLSDVLQRVKIKEGI